MRASCICPCSAALLRSHLAAPPYWQAQEADLERVCSHLGEHMIVVLDRDAAWFRLRRDTELYRRASFNF